MEQFLFLVLLIAMMWFAVNAGCEMIGFKGLPAKVTKPLRKHVQITLKVILRFLVGQLKKVSKK